MMSACAGDSARKPESNSAGVGLLGERGNAITAGLPQRGDLSVVADGGRSLDRRSGYADLAASTGTVGSPRGRSAEAALDGPDVTLNFVNTDIQEFVRVVFDEILKVTAVIDPQVTGKVTIRTAKPVSRSAALTLVKNALQANGAVLLQDGDLFRVSRASGRDGAGQSSRSEGVRTLPLRHINGEQARAALQPFLSPGSSIGVQGRNLVVAGSPADVDAVEQVLGSLDVDQMQGQSLVLLPLKDGSATAVASEMTQAFGASVKVLPIQRMNAVLVISRSVESLNRARAWIRRLDQPDRSDGRRMFVYPVQHRRATEIAQVLGGMFSQAGGQGGAAVAPKLTPTTASSAPPTGSATGPQGAAATVQPAAMQLPEAEIPPAAQGPMGAQTDSGRSDVQIRADATTNSIVVMAKPDEFRRVEAAIRRLDVALTQVLIEATIAEVRLNDALRHGVRWYFQSGNHGAILTDSTSGSTGEVFPGFNYTYQVPNAKVVISALEQITDLEVISSPAVTVLDNQTANLKVGDQVPIATRTAQGVTNSDAPVVNNIELKDTGIILAVTPRVNASGTVVLDISQEVSDVVRTTTSSIDSPTIRQRKINSQVAVQSGTEIALGGLISSRRETGKSGVPFLKDIPVLGAAFTSNAALERNRTELLVIIRPTIMANTIDAQAVTREIKARMTGAGGALYR
jgi:general secretion pathway protein D